MLKLTSNILDDIRERQKVDLGLIYWLMLINQGEGGDFKIEENNVMKFRDKVWVPDIPKLKKNILEEGHRSGLSMHPSATKMYQDLNKLFWRLGIKKEVVEFVYACLTC